VVIVLIGIEPGWRRPGRRAVGAAGRGFRRRTAALGPCSVVGVCVCGCMGVCGCGCWRRQTAHRCAGRDPIRDRVSHPSSELRALAHDRPLTVTYTTQSRRLRPTRQRPARLHPAHLSICGVEAREVMPLLTDRCPNEPIVQAAFRLDTGRTDGRSVVEVVAAFDVLYQCRLHWPPSQALPGQRARRRVVGRHDGAEPAEMGICLGRGKC
jgi:hypothetical protein